MVRPPNPAMAMAATAALAIVRRDGACDSSWSLSFVSSTPGCVMLVSLRSRSPSRLARAMRPARILLCQDPRRASSCSQPMEAMRHRPAWSIRRVCAVAHRSTTDLRRGRPSDLSPCPHPTLVGGDTRLATAREGRPGDGSGVSGAVVLCVLSDGTPMHRARARASLASGCPGSSGSFRTFLGWAQQQAPEAPVFV